jgi:precorrin-6A/cobalt-precorrin-6A reductase
VRILILGGTGEARELAAALVAAGTDVVSSLAGRVRQPRLPDGPVRVGGFGGVDGLATFLRAEGITRVIDATHPFAGAITANAALAAAEAGVPLLVLRRPGWEADPEWESVADIRAAAETVRAWPGDSVFLTTGRRDLATFAADDRHEFLVRAVDPPEGPVPPRMTLILDRGPYTVGRESALMREHRIGLLVTKNSGGPMTAAKLTAARDLGVRVVMVTRPPLPPGSTVAATVPEALRWLGVNDGQPELVERQPCPEEDQCPMSRLSPASPSRKVRPTSISPRSFPCSSRPKRSLAPSSTPLTGRKTTRTCSGPPRCTRTARPSRPTAQAKCMPPLRRGSPD